MSTPLHAVLVRSFPELEQLEHEWDRLAMSRSRPEIFHTFAWARAWWKAHGAECEIFTPVIRDSNGEVVAIWPLVRCNSELRALGHGESDHNDLLANFQLERPALEAALNLLAENRRLWKTGRIATISERSLLFEAASSLAGTSPLRMEILRSGTGFAATVEEDPARFKQLARKESLRRHRKKLERLGPVTFRHIEDAEEIKRHLDTLQRQHIQRWALRGIASQFLTSASKAHYEALPDYLSPSGTLRFGVLEVGGNPVAYHLGYELAGKMVWYKPTFDVDFSDYGPGEVLLQSVLQYCDSVGIQELDFTLGEESYKNRFSNITYGYFELFLFSHLSAEQYVLRARERIKRNAGLYAKLKSIWGAGNGWFRRVRSGLKRDGLVRFAGSRMRQLARACIFRRDEVIVFRRSHQASILLKSSVSDMEIVPLRLSLLADASLQNPDYFTSDRMQKFRERIAGGDRGLIAFHEGRVASVAWIGTRTSIVAGETGPDCVLNLPGEGAVIYDCWMSPELRNRGMYPAVMQSIISEQISADQEIWTYCLRDNLASREGILKAGFVQAARMVRVSWFNRRENCRVIQQ